MCEPLLFSTCVPAQMVRTKPIFSLLCLLACFLGLTDAAPPKYKKVLQTPWTVLKAECKAKVCNHLPALENSNCILHCASPSCYSKVYTEPLEPGEIDSQYGPYNACLRNLEQELKKLSPPLWPPRLGEDGRLMEGDAAAKVLAKG